MVFYECVLQVKHHTSEWAVRAVDGMEGMVTGLDVSDQWFFSLSLTLFARSQIRFQGLDGNDETSEFEGGQ